MKLAKAGLSRILQHVVPRSWHLLAAMLSMVAAFPAQAQPVPTISQISPPVASALGGTLITITGANFVSGATVSFGLNSASNVTFIDSNNLTATAPPSTNNAEGNVTVTVTNPSSQSVSVPAGLLYDLPPALTSITPTSGPTAGGYSVTLTGQYFRCGTLCPGGPTVRFGATPATNVVFNNNTTLTVTVPASAAGTVDVTETNSDGLSTVLAGGFTFTPPPSISQISPTVGSVFGGTPITITGANFVSGATVTFGLNNAISAAFVNSTTLTAVAPPSTNNAEGAVTVTVTNPSGQSGTLPGGLLYHLPPSLTTVTPNSGSIAGGYTVTLAGQYFRCGLLCPGGITVLFGSTPATNVIFNNNTTLTVSVPASTAGTVSVTETNSDGLSTVLANGFTFTPPPSVSQISPTVASALGGTLITITGANFLSGATVSFGQNIATNVNFVNSGTLTATAPPSTNNAEGSVTVTVTNPSGLSASLPAGLLYHLPPSLTTITPNTGSISGGYTVTLAGQYFRCGVLCPGGITVLFGSTPGTNVIFNSNTSLTVTVPAHAAGVVDVTETNPDGLSNVLAGGFTFIPPPSISQVSPAVASTQGGTLITITGANFVSGATVSFGQNTATNVNFVNSGTLTAAAPPSTNNAEGSVTVTVTNPSGQSANLPGGLQYDLPPSLTSIAPNSGSIAGGYTVTLTGQYFRCGTQCPGGPVVLFGSTPATNVIFNNNTTLTVTVPGEAAGTVSVTEINPDGLSTLLANGFTFVAPPSISQVSPAVASTQGGTLITIAGANFVSGATVSFGQNTTTNVNFVNSATLTATAPPSTNNAEGSVTVTVTNPSGQSANLPRGLQYDLPPSVTSITPNTGPAAGGYTVTLTGQYFRCGTQCPGGPTVLFGSAPATNVIFNNNTTLTVTVPAATAATVNVTEINTDGLSTVLANGFTFTASPTISQISPTVASTLGGTVITITGANFVSGSTVSFGQNNATNVTFVNSTTLQATAPPSTNNAEGSVTVTVTNPSNQSVSLLTGLVYDLPPSLTSINPVKGSADGGYAVTLTGQFFRCGKLCPGGPTVLFGTTPATNVIFNNNTTLTVTAPAHVQGTVKITETNTDGLSTVLLSAFTFIDGPAITQISPAAASAMGGTVITITGTGLGNGATVTFGQNSATKVVFINSTTLKATAPPSTNNAEGAVTVTVTNPSGVSATLPQGLVYDLPPVLTSITPNVGATAGGSTVTLTGQFFRCGTQCPGGPAVLFGTVPSPKVIFNNNTTLTVWLPAHGAGTYDVTETNTDGLSTVLANGFTFAPIAITDVSPAIGPTAGGETVTINGSGFTSNTTVSFGGTAAKSVTFGSATQLTAVTPAHSGGTVDVKAQDPAGSFNLPAVYQYTAGPVVLSLSPAEGIFGGGTRVALSGYNLAPVNSVLFGANAGTIDHTSPAEVVVTTPRYTTGTANPVNVTVGSPNGTQKLPGAFRYGLVILTQALDNGYPSIPYSNTLSAQGGAAPYQWSITGGALPPGLALNPATGTIGGTPGSSYGTYNITVLVKDSSTPAASSTASFSFNILFGFTPGPIPPTYFGMILYDQTKWPTVPVGALGKGLGTTWPFIEQQQGVFNWSILDQYVADAQSHFVPGQSTPLTLYWTNDSIPRWAAADQTLTPGPCSAYPGTSPPIFQCTGMVANIQYLTDFMTALVSRYQGLIQIYELWDEPNVGNVWTGSTQDMVTMTSAIYNVIRQTDPSAIILSPSSTSAQYLQSYLTTPGAPVGVDGVAVHGYPDVQTADVPEAIIGFKSVNVKLTMLAVPGMGVKPLWDTESSWGKSPCVLYNPQCKNQQPTTAISDQNLRAGYVMRSFLLHWAAGIQNFYWYGWDAPNWGTLWYPSQGTTLAGTAYGTVENWMVGATMPQPCSLNGGTTFSAIYTCALTRSNGYTALAVWDTNQTCTTDTSNNSTCTYSTYTPSPIYTQYRDATNTVHLITPGQPIKIGYVPILFENKPASGGTPPPFQENVTLALQGLTPAYGTTSQQITYQPLVPASSSSPTGACLVGGTAICNLLTVPGLSAPVPQSWMPANGAEDSDATLAVGATQVMQWADFGLQLFTKASSGAITPIGNAVSGAAFWSPGTACSTGVGADGMVNYDKSAGRWLVAMRSGTNSECIAVSQSSDATGQYYEYLVTYNDPGGKSYQMDWPRIGVWPDAYYLTFDMLDPSNNFAPVYAVACTLQRSAMIGGSATPSAACQQTQRSNSTGFFHLMPADQDSRNPPPTNEPETIYTFAKPVGQSAYHLYAYKFYTNFSVEAGNVLEGPYQVDTSSFSTVEPACNAGSVNCVPQPAPAVTPLDSVGGYLMYRAAYRNFGNHESVILTQAVQADSNLNPNPTPVGIRWYELRNISSNLYVSQQGFLESANSSTTADGFSRWMSSAAMDSSGNLSVGYSISGPAATSYYSGFPGIAIDWRNAATAATGTLFTERIVFPGVSVEEPTPPKKLGRWGAVSSMAIDPVDQCTFYFTGQYQPAASTYNWATRIVSFQVPAAPGGKACTPPVLTANWPPVQ